MTRASIRRISLAVEADRPAVGRVGEQDSHFLEGLANRAHPVAEGRRRRGDAEPARGLVGVDAPAPGGGIVGPVADLDLAAWKHEVAGGELARGVTADQQDLERA